MGPRCRTKEVAVSDELRREVDRQTIIWAINRVGFLDSFTQQALDAQTAVTFEARPKGTEDPWRLYVVRGENYDQVRGILEAKYDLQEIIDGRTLHG